MFVAIFNLLRSFLSRLGERFRQFSKFFVLHQFLEGIVLARIGDAFSRQGVGFVIECFLQIVFCFRSR
jgi:hypothetical protein